MTSSRGTYRIESRGEDEVLTELSKIISVSQNEEESLEEFENRREKRKGRQI